MLPAIKLLFRKFHDLPANLPDRHYRFFVFSNYAFLLAGLFHLAFIFIFALHDLYILSVYNIFSTLLWVLCIYLNFRGWWQVAITSGNIEILIHAALCVALLGWGSGFHYYVLCVPLIIFLSPRPLHVKIGICTLNCIAYGLLYYLAGQFSPGTAIRPRYVKAFNYINMTSIFFSISFIAYYYRRVVLNVEQNLEIAHGQTTRALSRLHGNLADAAVYVRSILPAPIDEGPVRSHWDFIPSESLGGDAFGYNWLDQDRFAIYLLDVSGHGVSAALLSATIANVLRTSALPQVDFDQPDQVLSALNRSFPSEDNNDMFFTIWYGVFNQRDGHLTYASGGHPPALLCTGAPNDPCFIRLGTPNHVVGGFEGAAYRQNVQKVDRAAHLYVFSDGVYEFLQTDGHRWKYNEFTDYLGRLHRESDEDFDRLLSAIKALNPSDVFEDDFTMLKVAFT